MMCGKEASKRVLENEGLLLDEREKDREEKASLPASESSHDGGIPDIEAAKGNERSESCMCKPACLVLLGMLLVLLLRRRVALVKMCRRSCDMAMRSVAEWRPFLHTRCCYQ
mmetsp:Transcript_126219/g.404003  ORF Transcript_126219/g.404003 Transcript_126219/m.404003 type:complete len:112 (-) Transcript_126219:261-596(-)